MHAGMHAWVWPVGRWCTYAQLLAFAGSIVMAVATQQQLPPVMHAFHWQQAIVVVDPDTSRAAARHAMTEDLIGLASARRSRVVSNNGGWQSNTNILAVSDDSVSHRSSVRGQVEMALETYAKRALITQEGHPLGGELVLNLTASWANVNGPHHYNHPHVHPGALCSGVLYLSCPHTSACALRFQDPRPAPRRADASWYVAAGASGDREVSIAEGGVVVFPAFVRHSVPTWADDAAETVEDRRVSIAFNAEVAQYRHGNGKLRVSFVHRRQKGPARRRGKKPAVAVSAFARTLVTKTFGDAAWTRELIRAVFDHQTSLDASDLLTSAAGESARRCALNVVAVHFRRVAESAAPPLGGVAKVGLTSLRLVGGGSAEIASGAAALPSDVRGAICIAHPRRDQSDEVGGINGGSGCRMFVYEPRPGIEMTKSTPVSSALGYGSFANLGLFAGAAMAFPGWLDHSAVPIGRGQVTLHFEATVDWQPGEGPLKIEVLTTTESRRPKLDEL
jgi:uncharacterized protein (TIGR02466 family)